MIPHALSTTIVIPTYNEGGNVPELVRRLGEALDDEPVEILFVDDSSDNTPDVILRTAQDSALPIRLLHREGAQKVGGLSGAVTAGIREARGDVVVVMDGDLQHPPETVPILLAAIAEGDHDLAVASRYVGDGAASGLSSSLRRVVSSSSTLLARSCFPRRVGRVCTDPMTGFFAVRKNSIDLGRLHPRGFKILLEILARHDLDVVEVPFVFADRLAGESKASWSQGMQFLRQMLSLRMGVMSRFASIGVLGTVVNLVVMWAMLRLGVHYLVSAVVAAELSILHNFVLQERFAFRYLRDGKYSLRGRLGHHLLFNNVEALVRLPFLALLVETLHFSPIPAQALLLVLAFVVRFFYTTRVVYSPAEPVQSPVLTPEFVSDDTHA